VFGPSLAAAIAAATPLPQHRHLKSPPLRFRENDKSGGNNNVNVAITGPATRCGFPFSGFNPGFPTGGAVMDSQMEPESLKVLFRYQNSPC
jgi:hypothetical protein